MWCLMNDEAEVSQASLLTLTVGPVGASGDFEREDDLVRGGGGGEAKPER